NERLRPAGQVERVASESTPNLAEPGIGLVVRRDVGWIERRLVRRGKKSRVGARRSASQGDIHAAWRAERTRLERISLERAWCSDRERSRKRFRHSACTRDAVAIESPVLRSGSSRDPGRCRRRYRIERRGDRVVRWANWYAERKRLVRSALYCRV